MTEQGDIALAEQIRAERRARLAGVQKKATETVQTYGPNPDLGHNVDSNPSVTPKRDPWLERNKIDFSRGPKGR